MISSGSPRSTRSTASRLRPAVIRRSRPGAAGARTSVPLPTALNVVHLVTSTGSSNKPSEVSQRTLGRGTAVLLATTAQAQEGSGLSEQDVRGFIEPLGQQAVSEGDLGAVYSWMQQHLADDATLAVEGGVVVQGGPVMSFELAMSAEDFARFAGLLAMAGGGGMMGSKALEDYGLEVEIMGVQALPLGKARAAVVFYEHGSLPGAGVYDGATTCGLRLSRDGEGQDVPIVIEAAACEVAAVL